MIQNAVFHPGGATGDTRIQEKNTGHSRVCRQATRASSPITDTRAMELHEETCMIPQMRNYPSVAQWKESELIKHVQDYGHP